MRRRGRARLESAPPAESRAPTRSGQFGISSLPPGDYYVVAIPEEQSADWRDPARCSKRSRGSRRRSRSAKGSTRRIDLAAARGAPVIAAVLLAAGARSIRRRRPRATRVRSRRGRIRRRSRRRDVRRGAAAAAAPRARHGHRAGAADGARTAITADDGAFVIVRPAAPGRYTVAAAKDGYVAMSHGATRPPRHRRARLRWRTGRAAADRCACRAAR